MHSKASTDVDKVIIDETEIPLISDIIGSIKYQKYQRLKKSS